MQLNTFEAFPLVITVAHKGLHDKHRIQRGPHSPLGVEDAEERGPTPVLARQGEDSPQVVEGDVALGEAALQPRFLEGGPLFLQSPGATQVSLRGDGSGRLNTSLMHSNRSDWSRCDRPLVADSRIGGTLTRRWI